MRFELKKFKAHKELSEETLCFDADLWADGAKVAFVCNHGTGGCHEVRWLDQTKGKEIEALCASQPDEEYDDYGMHMVVKYEVDTLVDKLIDMHERDKWLKTQCKKHVLFRLKGDQADSWRMIKNMAWDEKIEALIREKNGDNLERIANATLGNVSIELT